MTPQEKLKRISSPQSVEDYGMVMTLDEMLDFEEGREFAADFFCNYVPMHKWPDEIIELGGVPGDGTVSR